MTTITVSSPEQQKGGISLGRQGEYGVREVVFSLSDYISEYGEGTAVLVHKLCDCADPYLVPVEDQGTFDYAERVDDTLIWHIGQMATYKKGYGQIELFWYVDGALKKSVIFGTSVAKSLEYDETRSLNIQKTYLDSISKVLAKSIENAADILRELDEADRLYNLAIGAAESIATLTVSSETVAPDVPAGVERQVSPENQVNLHFLIPRGEKGETGSSAPFVLRFTPASSAAVPILADKTFAEFEEAYQAGAPIYAYYEGPLTLAAYSDGEYVQFTQRTIVVLDDDVTFITEELQLNSDDTISSQSFPQTFSKDQVFTIQFSKNGNSYQSDKTYSEVVNAYAAGKILIAEYDGTNFYLRTHAENDGYEFASVNATLAGSPMLIDTRFVIYPNNDVDYIHREFTIAPPLIGSSVNTTPTDVINALAAGRPVSLTFTDPVYGNIVFTDFSHIANRGMVTSELFFVQNSQYNLIQLYGTTANSRWATNRTILTDLEALNRKLDAPSSSGTSGQILSLDEHLKPVWSDPAASDDELYIVTYRPGGAYPDANAIIEAYDAGKAIFAHIIDGDGGRHILPLTTIEWENGALESMVFSGGGWSFERKRIMPSAAVTWILTPPLPSIDDVVNYIFRATYNSQTDSYTVTSAPTLEELWETVPNGPATVITLYLDGGEEVYVGSDIQFNDVDNDSPGFCEVSLAPGDIGFYQLFGTSGGWTMRLVLFTDANAYYKPLDGIPKTDLAQAVQTSLGKADTALQSVPSSYRTAADQDLIDEAQDTAIAAKYTKPESGIPASDLAAGVIPDISGKANAADVAALASRLNAIADSDDTTLDQLSEIVAYIKSNKFLIDNITTGKVSVSDIVDNLTSSATNKPLSANQGRALKALIDAIVVPTESTVSGWGFTKNTGTYSKPSGGIPKTDLANDVQTSLGKADTALQEHQPLTAYRTAADQDNIDEAQDTAIAAKYTKPESGIPASDLAAGVIPTVPTKTSDLTNDSGFVDASGAAAAAPIQSVNGKTGTVVLNASDVGAGTYSKPSSGISKTDLASDVQTSLGKADTALQSYTETDPTVPAWAKAAQPTMPIGHLDSTSTATVMTATIPGITELKDGVRVWLRNGVITSASGVTLNINGLGAKPIYNSLSGAVVTTTFTAASTYLFIYNTTRVAGGCWDMVYGYDANTTYTPAKLGQGYAVCSTAAATVAKTASISGYTLVANGIVAIKFANDVPANATLNITSKGAKAIYYKGAAITAGVIKAGDTVTMIYSTYYHVLSIDRDADTLPPSPSDDNPQMAGSALPGSSTDYARADHVHPSDTSKIGYDDKPYMVTMTASGSTVTCFKTFLQIYTIFYSQRNAYFILAASQTDYQLFTIDRVDGGNQTIYFSSIVGGVLSQIVLTPGDSSTMTGTLTAIDLNLQSASGVSF